MRADKVPTVSSWHTGRFLVRVQVDEDTENTAVVVAGSDWVSWTDELHLWVHLAFNIDHD
jgi:trans-2-enoyl-CoA reductase